MEDLFVKIFEALSSIEGSAVTIALVFEFVFRMFPSKKPLSFLYALAYILKKSGEISIKVGELLDKILPQKLK